MRAHVLARLREMLVQDFRVPPHAVCEEAHLRKDLWLDSHSLLDIVYVVQSDFGFEAHLDEFRDVQTVGALADLILAHTTTAVGPT